MNDSPNIEVSPPSTDSQVSSFRHILKATSLLGGASMITMGVSLVRSKLAAELLGTAGIGLMGMYLSVTGLALAVVNCGLAFSAVRELAEARGSGDKARMADTMVTFRRLTLALALVGTLGLALLAWPVSMLMFKSDDYVWSIVILAPCIAAGILGNYYSAIVQAAGKVSNLAAASVLGALLGAAAAIFCFFTLGKDGIVAAMVAGALIQTALIGWVCNSLNEPENAEKGHFSRQVAKHLLQVGGMVVGIGIVASLSQFSLRLLMMRELGESGVGYFQAAYGLAILCSTYIIGAMGTDLLPRLSAATSEPATMCRLVNEQTQVALLLGLPGIVGTIVAAPYVIPLLYASDFGPAVPVLQLMTVSVFGRLLAFPVGFILVAKKCVRITIGAEILALIVQLLVVWICMPVFGVQAASLASIAVYAIHTFVLYSASARLVGMRWSKAVWRMVLLGLIVIGTSLAVAWHVPMPQRLAFDFALLTGTTWYCFTQLAAASNVTQSSVVRKIRQWFGKKPQLAPKI
jgi:PST family polysaccharide transporter